MLKESQNRALSLVESIYSKNITLKINNNVYEGKFDFEMVMENEVFLTIDFYNFLSQDMLFNSMVQLSVDDKNIFNGVVYNYRLDNDSDGLKIKAYCRQDLKYLQNLKSTRVIDDNSKLCDLMTNNLHHDITFHNEVKLGEINLIEKLHVIQQHLKLSYFSITNDHIHFVNFNDTPYEINDVFKVETNTSEDNFKYTRLLCNFQEDLCSGSTIVHEGERYIVESIISYWKHDDQRIFQEIHCINKSLHDFRYLK